MHDKIRVRFLMQDRGQLYGAERAVLDLVNDLREVDALEISVCLIEERRVRGGHSAFLAALEAIGLDCQRYSVSGRISLGLVQFLRAWSGDVDVVHTIGPKATVYAAVARPRGTRLVSTLHGWLFRKSIRERLYEWLELCAFKRFDRVVVLTQFYADLLSKKVVLARNLAKIPTAWHEEKENQFHHSPELRERSEPGPFRVGMLARFSSEKNHMMLLRAAIQLKGEDKAFQFILAGEGPTRGDLERTVREEDIVDMVQFSSYIEPRIFWPAVDALVVCSRIENQPYSIMEAMAYGIPVVGTRVGGIPELLADGKAGILVDLDDDKALAHALRRLKRDQHLRVQLVRSAQELLTAQYSHRGVVDGYLTLYQELVNV